MVMRLAILGSTGSIGISTLNVVRQHPDRVQIVALAAGQNVDALASQIAEFAPAIASVSTAQALPSLRQRLPAAHGAQLHAGAEGLMACVMESQADVVLVAVLGLAGLEPTLAALEQGCRVLMVTKETLVAGGPLVRKALAGRTELLMPVDSEHNALFQLLDARPRESVRTAYLTASGGPFRSWAPKDIAAATVEQALRHPTWRMGAKVTIDSATLMNKGLEVIEAHELFDLPYAQLEVLVHPQSLVHALVRLKDGALLAHVGTADMRVPIAHALFHPQRVQPAAPELDPATMGTLEFMPPRWDVFPALQLAFSVGKIGGTLPAVLTAANDEVVARFLRGDILFGAMVPTVEQVLSEHVPIHPFDRQDLYAVDAWARRRANELVDGRRGGSPR